MKFHTFINQYVNAENLMFLFMTLNSHKHVVLTLPRDRKLLQHLHLNSLVSPDSTVVIFNHDELDTAYLLYMAQQIKQQDLPIVNKKFNHVQKVHKEEQDLSGVDVIETEHTFYVSMEEDIASPEKSITIVKTGKLLKLASERNIYTYPYEMDIVLCHIYEIYPFYEVKLIDKNKVHVKLL
jgi:hypothetical protein